MKILLVASEVAPVIKIGGLGDVVGSLPKALAKIGVNADVIVPFFPTAVVTGLSVYKCYDLSVPFSGQDHNVEVYKTQLESGTDIFLLKNSYYFASGGKNFFAQNYTETEMFTFFDACVVQFVKSALNTYNIIHCNDWHTGLITHLLEDELGRERPKTLFTIHNIIYQGVGTPELLKHFGYVPGSHQLIDWDVADGDINMLQQGITSSDFVNTVSPTYATEILTKEFGGGFEDILQSRKDRLSGILNGIDFTSFPSDITTLNYKTVKSEKKRQLMSKLGMSASDLPIFSFVGRIDAFQKGLSLLAEALPELLKNYGSFVLLGSGDKKWEARLVEIGEKFGKKTSINIKFDADLANLIYAGSDFLLVPSKYEPCGLIQMIAMHYGTLPIVHGVGGLKDTVSNGDNGFVFNDFTTDALLGSVKEAVNVYNTPQMDKMIENSLKKDFSWDKSALEYKKLYERILSS